MPSPFGDTTTGMIPRFTLAPPSDRLLMELERRKVGLVAYCQIKLDAGDWHAVQDAASDIRELEAKLELLRDGK